MGRFRKRAIIPSALICLAAILYFAARLLLSGAYVRSAVFESLAGKFDCHIEMAGATLGLRSLTLRDVLLSYRKSDRLYNVAEIGRMTITFQPQTFFRTGVFDGIRMEDVVVTLERDGEGWLTLGRIVEPRATLATKAFKIDFCRLCLRVGNRDIPVESARIEVRSTPSRVDLTLSEAVLNGGRAKGEGCFSMEEDPRLEGEVSASGIRLAHDNAPAQDGAPAVSGTLSCRLRLKGKASSPSLLAKESSLTIDKLSAGIVGKGAVFEANQAVLALQGLGDKGSRFELKTDLLGTTINVTPWIHAADSPDHLTIRDRLEGLFRECPDFNAAVGGAGLRLVYDNVLLPFDSFSGQVRRQGTAIIFKDMQAGMAGGGIQASWRHLGTDTASRYDGRLSARNLDVSRLVENTPLKGRKLGGALSGEMRFATAASAGGGPEGNGRILISEASLWALPIFDALAQAAHLDTRKAGAGFLKADFTMDKDMFHVSAVEFGERGVNITGNGDIYYSGEVDLRFQVAGRQPHPRNVPVVDDFVGLLSDAFSTRQQGIHITGSFMSPTAVPLPSPGK